MEIVIKGDGLLISVEVPTPTLEDEYALLRRVLPRA